MLERTKEKKAKTILVAGGAGFVGSHLCDALLAEGNRVIALDNYLTSSPANVLPLENHPAFAFIEQDICDPLEVDEKLDAIYNLACPASPRRYQADPIHTMMTSVIGTRNLLALAASHGARFLQASTSEVYGDPQEHPQREDYRGSVNCTGPRACYDEGKRAAEALCFDSLRMGRVDARVVRIFNTYGPRMQPDDGRIISNFIVQALSGQPITVYGDGRQTRSFCYVSDLVEGIRRTMNLETNPGVPLNLGNPNEVRVDEIARIVLEEIPTASRVVHEPLPIDDPQRRRPDITRARQLLGWEPRVDLRDGLSRTIAWFTDALADGAVVPPNRGSKSSRLSIGA